MRDGRPKPGNRSVRAALVQAVHGVRRTKTSRGERSRRLKKRRGSKRAVLAIGHAILVMYSHMRKTGEQYQEKGEAFFLKPDRGKVQDRLVQRLERMGESAKRSKPTALTRLA